MKSDDVPSKRCVLITNGNPLSMLSLGGWIRRFGSHIAKIYVTRKLPSQRSNVLGVLRMLRTSGWAYTDSKLWMNVILPRRLRRERLPGSVEEFVRHCGLSIETQGVDNVNEPAMINEIRSLRPSFLVSQSATQRFDRDLFDTPTSAAINVHWGMLPAYAGLSPYFWHLYNQEPAFGVTLHRIEEKLDAGAIIKQESRNIGDTQTVLEVAVRMAETVSPLLCWFFDDPSAMTRLRKQDPSGRTYYRHPTRGQMRTFHRNGFRMLDRASKQLFVDRVRAIVVEGNVRDGGGSAAASPQRCAEREVQPS